MQYPSWKSSRKKSSLRARRRPEQSALYQLIYHYRDKLERTWLECFQSNFGVLRDEVLAAFDKYLDCGIVAHGCARAVCESCKHSELLAFSCKKRGVCSSCDAKQACIFAENLTHNVLLPVEHTHQVFTIPKRLRVYFKFNRELHHLLFQAAWSAWQELIDDALPGCAPASVMALHSAGDLLNFHPHIHALTALGGVDGNGSFHSIESVDTRYLEQVFARELFESFQNHSLLDSDTISSMKSWSHSGFNVFVGEPIGPRNTESRLFVSRYLRKSAISNTRLQIIDEHTVRYTKYSDGAKSHREFHPLEFLAELSQHIPNKWEQTVRYFGRYSARARGAKRLREKQLMPISLIEPSYTPSKTWASCMKKIFELNPLECPKCGAQMKIKAFIHDTREIIRITENLNIQSWIPPPKLPKTKRVA
ncbi:MAG: transposase [Bdellovibrionales bacterium]|nr:transposase [Bdellovibrionales bacterium]